QEDAGSGDSQRGPRTRHRVKKTTAAAAVAAEGARKGAGRPPGSHGKNKTLRDRVEDLSRTLPVVIPPKPIIDADEKDAAAQANEIMQHAGKMAQLYRGALLAKESSPPQKALDEYMHWVNVVLRIAAMLLPYQRPTYRSIEIRDERGAEDRRRI